MKYVTRKMIAEHAKKAPLTVHTALRNAGVQGERIKGVSGLRYPLTVANKFLARQWPEAGPMTEAPAREEPICSWCVGKPMAGEQALVSHTICDKHNAELRAEAGLLPRAGR